MDELTLELALVRLREIEAEDGPLWSWENLPEGRRWRTISREVTGEELDLREFVATALTDVRPLTEAEQAYALTLEAADDH